MPTRVPYTDVSDEWKPEVARGHARNFQELEQLPRISRTISTGFTTTSSTAVPITGLVTTMAVPGNAYVKATAFLDMAGDANVISVGELYSWGPSASTYSLSTETTAQVVFTQDPAVANRRATVGQQWVLPAPEPGTWRFQLRLRRAGAGVSANIGDHNTFVVEVH